MSLQRREPPWWGASNVGVDLRVRPKITKSLIPTALLLLACAAPSFAEDMQMLPRDVDRTIDVVHDGRARAVIVYGSAGDNGLLLAQRLRHTIADVTGIELEIAPDTDVVPQLPAWPDERFRRIPLILIGNLNTNRAVVPLYAGALAAADLLYPGADGFILRTIVDPYAAGANQLLLGASSPRGFERAVEAFEEVLKSHSRQGELRLPPLLRVEPGQDYDRRFNDVKIAVDDNSSSSNAAHYALHYRWTADPAALAAALEIWRRQEFLKEDTKAFNPDHYGKEGQIRGLIATINVPGLTGDEILRADNAMLRGLQEEYSGYWIVHDADWLGTRHQTIGMLGFLVTADYLLRWGKPNTPAQEVLQKCVDEGHAYFRQFERNHRDEGFDNTSYHSAGPILRYMMTHGNTAFFKSGTAHRMALRALMSADNRGWFIAPGNYEDVRQGRVMSSAPAAGAALGIPAFVLADGQLRWIAENVPGIGPPGGDWGFSSGLAGLRYPLDARINPVKPLDWLGVSVMPCLDYYYELSGDYMTHGAGRKQRPWWPLVPRDKAVEMITFRDTYAPEGQYLCLSGVHGGRYSSIDANAILRYTDRGKVWLIQQTEQLGHYFKNALAVGHGHQPDYLDMAGCTRLDALGNFPEVGMTATTLPDLNRADWTRHVFWRRGEYFIVFDTAAFREDGDYDLTCTWRSLPIAALEDNVWVARQGGSRFELHNADAIHQSSEHEIARPAEGVAVYPYTLRQHRSLSARKGNHAHIRNLFFTCPDDAPEGYRVRPVGPDAVVVSNDQDYCALVGVTMTGKTEVGPLTTDARMFHLSTESVRLLPETARVWLNGQELASGPSTNTVAIALRNLCDSAQPAAFPESPNEPVTTAWRFDDLHRPQEVIPHVRLSSTNPPTVGVEETLFDRQTLLWAPPVQWPEGSTLTFDLGRIETLDRIEFGQALAWSSRPAEWCSPAPEEMRLAFSDDNFASAERSISLKVDVTYRHDPPPIYKPYSFSAKRRLLLRTPEVKARYVRLDATHMDEATFFRRATRPPVIQYLEPVDLNSDGVDELAVATDAGELVLLDSGGRLKWKKSLRNPITALLAASLDPSNPPALYVADNGWVITGFDIDGNDVYHADCFIDGKAAAAGVYDLATCLPQGSELRCLVAATGTSASTFDAQGNVVADIVGHGIASDLVLKGHSQAPRTRHRTAVRDAWGHLDVVDLHAEEPASTMLGCYWWLGVAFEYWPLPQDHPDAGLAVAVFRAGTNACDFAAETPISRWNLPASGPVSCCAFADLDGDRIPELLLGRLDGFIDVIDHVGAMRASWTVGAPVCDLAVIGDSFFIATGCDVRVLDPAGSITHRISLPAKHLAVIRTPEGGALALASTDGSVTALPANRYRSP